MTVLRALAIIVGVTTLAVPSVAQPSLALGEASDSQRIAVTAEAAVVCAVAASASGVDMARLASDDEWIVTDTPRGVRHNVQPVVITVVPPNGDQPESCAVEATLVSQYDQQQLIAALRALLPVQPMQERGGLLWRIGRAGNGRTLFMVTDDAAPQPVIRFTGFGF